mmetsp:Transcript_51135/g.119812  ORF Transcript_51135/g.119812 Transcript_51135/m.119812 type:complete len:1063 (+) Transcript_51135:86-3274(+)
MAVQVALQRGAMHCVAVDLGFVESSDGEATTPERSTAARFGKPEAMQLLPPSERVEVIADESAAAHAFLARSDATNATASAASAASAADTEASTVRDIPPVMLAHAAPLTTPSTPPQVDLVTPERMKRRLPEADSQRRAQDVTCVKVPRTQQPDGASEMWHARSRPAHEDQRESNVENAKTPNEGYPLRDLRRVIAAMLPRYGHLLRTEETRALAAFSSLSLHAQQLYARLLGRKWPQWIQLAGLGSRYCELGEESTCHAVVELVRAAPCAPVDLTACTQQLPGLEEGDLFWSAEAPKLDDGELCEGAVQHQPSDVAPWLLDSACETVATLFSRSLQPTEKCNHRAKDNFAALLLEACPMSKLREFASNLGLTGLAKAGKSSKEDFRKLLCTAARQQRVLEVSAPGSSRKSRACGTTEARLVSQVLSSGRWVCIAPTPGQEALMALIDVFHMETTGAPASSFVVFRARFPGYKLTGTSLESRQLFHSREALDAFLRARRLALQLADERTPFTLEDLCAHAATAEKELKTALEILHADAFETQKVTCPCRRQFTAVWCWTDALYEAVMRSPALHDDHPARVEKIRRLRLLMHSQLGLVRRGRCYNELAKELVRAEGTGPALQVAACGLAEGEPPPHSVRVSVDLTAEHSSQEMEVDSHGAGRTACLPRHARWELARRCYHLARNAVTCSGGRGGAARAATAWRKHLRDLDIAKQKAEGGDDAGRWLPALVERLIAEETAAATKKVQCIAACSQGMPTDGAREASIASRGLSGGRRLFAGYDLAELTVEELAMRHYLAVEGFQCGIHCEGALLRDLFGILLFEELFDTSIDGAFVSEYQDAPLDLGSECFYERRRDKIEARLCRLAEQTPNELANEVKRMFADLHGTLIRGVSWDRYLGSDGFFRKSSECPGGCEASGAASQARSRSLWTSSAGVPEEAGSVAAVAGAIGGSALAHILRLLCQDYTSAGLPDLFLWTWPLDGGQPRAVFVEVKSERDKLSRRQSAWLAELRAGGAAAEVCHVKDPKQLPDEELEADCAEGEHSPVECTRRGRGRGRGKGRRFTS